jgi:hypothetical protein
MFELKNASVGLMLSQSNRGLKKKHEELRGTCSANPTFSKTVEEDDENDSRGYFLCSFLHSSLVERYSLLYCFVENKENRRMTRDLNGIGWSIVA